MKKALFLSLLVICILNGHAAVSDTAHKARVHVIPLPIFYYTPETRVAFGVGASLTFKLNPSEGTNYSQILVVTAYTQNKQIVLYFPYEVYSKNSLYFLDGEFGFFKYSYYYWGIGDDVVEKELYEVQFPRAIVNGYRKVCSHFYAGIDYAYEHDIMLKTDTNGVLFTGLVPGSKGSIASGLGVNFLYDSRDSLFFPTKGLYINATSYFNSSELGATNTFSKLTTDFSWYTQLSRSFILAINQRSIFTFGDVPFNQLALVGGSRQMRGYYFGYYRDNYMMLFQSEARIHLHGPWGLAVFGATALIGHPGSFPDANGPIFAEGIGLRFNANRRQHINIRGDIGYGNTVEYYLSVEEAF